MVKISKFGKAFLLLALRINKHIKGYVDFYFGPEKLRQIVDNESPTSPNKLLKDSITLIQQLGAQGYNNGRERYLEKLLTAMKTSIEILNGTEISIKDQFMKLYDVDLLYRELNQFEHSILILHSPKLVISEGIANKAISILFSNQEVAEIGLNEFCSDPSKEVPLEELELQDIIKAKIPLFWYNFAYHALVDRYHEKELMRYGKNFEIFTKEDLITEIERMSTPVYSNNAFMYYIGNNILQSYGDVPSLKDFQNLLVNPILPSDLI